MKKVRINLALLVAFLCCFCRVWADVPPEYYAGVNGKKKSELKTAFRTIIRKATMLDYGSGARHTWSGFYQADRFNGNQVRDRYSYGVFYFPSDHVSAASGMNIEHSFPKSWWGGDKNQAYKDLFNLMPCEISINTAKSNFAMGVVTTVSTNNGCTKVGKGSAGNKTANLWEPADEWKGDFARSYFYMVTAYSDLVWTGEGLTMLEKNEWPTLQRWAYELFLKWNRQDPVDDIERQRNEVVYGIQGNRNPCVDFPNLPEYIWGDSVDYAFDVNGAVEKPAFEVTPESADFAAEAGLPSEPVLVTVVMKATTSNLFTIVASDPFVVCDDPDADAEDWSQRMMLSGSKTGSSFYVRLSAQQETGDYMGTLTLSTTGMDNLVVPLTARVSQDQDGLQDLFAIGGKTDAWYTLSGIRLSGEPRYRGIFIRRGRKVVR